MVKPARFFERLRRFLCGLTCRKLGQYAYIYQEALTIPGISPLLASSRKQIRHKRKSRMKPALRPHFQQRRIIREENFACFKLLSALAMRDFLAILFALIRFEREIH